MKKLPLSKLCKMLADGYSIITIGDKKQPNFKWKSLQTTPLTKDELTQRYNAPSTLGQGYCTGYNNIEVIDVDLKIFDSLSKQQEIWAEYLGLLRDHISDFDQKFVIYKTISNGYHIIYKCQTIAGNTKIATPKGYTAALIESRGKGGYCFIYDTQISPLGYSEVKEISIEDRECLWALSRLYDYREPEPEAAHPQATNYTEKTTPWTDFNHRHDVWFVCYDDFKVVRKLKDKTLILRHGSDAAHSGYIFEDSGIMYLFTTGTIYPNEKALRPYDLYTWKYHGGNYSASAKDLYSKGYGSRQVRPIPAMEKKPDITLYDFPLDIFPTQIQNYIIECANSLNSNIDYMGSAMLWNISVICGNCMRVVVKPGWVETGNIWIALVGSAGVGKTPSINNIIFPLERANAIEIKNYIRQYEMYQAYAALTKKEQKDTEEVRKPKRTQFIANDVTLEALIEMHSENKNAVGVFKYELAGWIKDMNKYRAGSDLEFWLSSWSGKSVSVSRKTASSAFIQYPHIPVLGGIQPGVLSQFFTAENKDNGFIDRLLTATPEAEVSLYSEKQMDDDVIEWYESYILKFYQAIKNTIEYDYEGEIKPSMIKLSDGAKKEFIRIHDEITEVQKSDDENEYLKSMLPKQKSYVARFALLINTLKAYAGIEGYYFNLIHKESMLGAEKLSTYFISHAKKVKVDSIELKDLKTIFRDRNGKSNEELVKEIFLADSEFNRTKVAELLGISRMQVIRLAKK